MLTFKKQNVTVYIEECDSVYIVSTVCWC